VGWTVRVSEAGDVVGDDLDPAGRGLERMAFGVMAEIFEQHVVALGRRQFDETLGPELLETGKGDALACRARADLVVDPLAPAHLVAIAGERRFVTEAPRQRAEDVEVVPGLADQINSDAPCTAEA